ncbi:hypothetical protein DFJ77DRAFT_510116 [Powellomyces hirtus]|nr:hypothetical protein DFJ77DRAFT_510116 [Powellomyces hirtus]
MPKFAETMNNLSDLEEGELPEPRKHGKHRPGKHERRAAKHKAERDEQRESALHPHRRLQPRNNKRDGRSMTEDSEHYEFQNAVSRTNSLLPTFFKGATAMSFNYTLPVGPLSHPPLYHVCACKDVSPFREIGDEPANLDRNSTLGLSKDQQVLFWHIPWGMDHVHADLLPDLEAFGAAYPHSKKGTAATDCRHLIAEDDPERERKLNFLANCSPHYTVHLGVHKMCNLDHVNKKFYNITPESRGSIDRDRAVVALKATHDFNALARIVGEGLKVLDANVSATYKEAYNRMDPYCKDFWTNTDNDTFPYLIIIYNEFSNLYRDLGDAKDGFCTSVGLESFWGYICIPELKIRIRFAPGDIIYLRSWALAHQVTDIKGKERYSMVFVMHEAVVKKRN